VRTETTTTDWELNTAGTQWVKAKPITIVTVTTRAANVRECPTLNTPVGGGGGGDSASAALVRTGFDPTLPLLGAALLMVLGLGAGIWARRRVQP